MSAGRRRPVVVIAETTGQLGNRLFLFAHLIAGAIDHGYTLVNPFFGEYAASFVGTREDLWCRYPRRKSWIPPSPARRRRLAGLASRAVALCARRLRDAGPRHGIAILESGRTTTLVDPGGLFDLSGPHFRSALASARVVLLRGPLFRGQAYLVRHAAAVREHFRPPPQVERQVAAFMAGVRREHETVVGVHLRQGDYRQFLQGRYFYSTAQYADLMRRVVPLFGGSKVVFLVCSDEAQDRTVFGALPIELGIGSISGDLFSLARCDYLLGPTSTFGMWSSFFGGVPRYEIDEIERTPGLADFQPVQG